MSTISVPNFQETRFISVKKFKWLQFRKKIYVYFKNHIKHSNTKVAKNAAVRDIKAFDINSNANCTKG